MQAQVFTLPCANSEHKQQSHMNWVLHAIRLGLPYMPRLVFLPNMHHHHCTSEKCNTAWGLKLHFPHTMRCRRHAQNGRMPRACFKPRWVMVANGDTRAADTEGPRAVSGSASSAGIWQQQTSINAVHVLCLDMQGADPTDTSLLLATSYRSASTHDLL